MTRTFCFALALTACAPKDLGDPASGDPTANGLPDPRESFEHTCEDVNVDGCPIAAATGILAGDYVFDGETVTGFEYWWLHPNAALVEAPEDLFDSAEPCLVVWDIFGTRVTEDMACSGCAYELHVSGTYSEDLSDCVESLADASGRDFAGVYDVRPAGGDAVRMAFQASGNEFGAGQETNKGLTWTSDPQCEALGSATCPND